MGYLWKVSLWCDNLKTRAVVRTHLSPAHATMLRLAMLAGFAAAAAAATGEYFEVRAPKKERALPRLRCAPLCSTHRHPSDLQQRAAVAARRWWPGCRCATPSSWR